MKKFLLRLFLFALPIICVSYPIDWYISKMLRKSNSFAGWEYPTWNAILDGTVNSEIIINGSSRAWIDVNATMVGKAFHTNAFDIGIDAHNFYLEYLRHRLLLDHNPKPKLIIQILDNHSLAKVPELNNPDQFLPFMLWNSKMRDAIVTYEGFNYYDCMIPLIRYYGKLSAFKEVKRLKKNPLDNPETRIRGSYEFDKEWDPTEFEKLKKELKKQHKTTYDTNLDAESVALFDKYLKDCKANGIKIVLIYAPEFVDGQKIMGNRKQIMDLYVHFSKKYDVPYYDYSNDPISHNHDYFYNIMHLNKVGAQAFTADLVGRLKEEKSLKPIFKIGF